MYGFRPRRSWPQSRLESTRIAIAVRGAARELVEVGEVVGVDPERGPDVPRGEQRRPPPPGPRRGQDARRPRRRASGGHEEERVQRQQVAVADVDAAASARPRRRAATGIQRKTSARLRSRPDAASHDRERRARTSSGDGRLEREADGEEVPEAVVGVLAEQEGGPPLLVLEEADEAPQLRLGQQPARAHRVHRRARAGLLGRSAVPGDRGLERAGRWWRRSGTRTPPTRTTKRDHAHDRERRRPARPACRAAARARRAAPDGHRQRLRAATATTTASATSTGSRMRAENFVASAAAQGEAGHERPRAAVTRATSAARRRPRSRR